MIVMASWKSFELLNTSCQRDACVLLRDHDVNKNTSGEES